jgi:hypothetical protein
MGNFKWFFTFERKSTDKRLSQKFIAILIVVILIAILFIVFEKTKERSRSIVMWRGLSGVQIQALTSSSSSVFPKTDVFCGEMVEREIRFLENAIEPKGEEREVVCFSDSENWFVYVEGYEGEEFDGYCVDSGGYMGPVIFDKEAHDEYISCRI